MFSYHPEQSQVSAEWVERRLHAMGTILSHQLHPERIYIARTPGAQKCDLQETCGPITHWS